MESENKPIYLMNNLNNRTSLYSTIDKNINIKNHKLRNTMYLNMKNNILNQGGETIIPRKTVIFDDENDNFKDNNLDGLFDIVQRNSKSSLRKVSSMISQNEELSVKEEDKESKIEEVKNIGMKMQLARSKSNFFHFSHLSTKKKEKIIDSKINYCQADLKGLNTKEASFKKKKQKKDRFNYFYQNINYSKIRKVLALRNKNRMFDESKEEELHKTYIIQFPEVKGFIKDIYKWEKNLPLNKPKSKLQPSKIIRSFSLTEKLQVNKLPLMPICIDKHEFYKNQQEKLQMKLKKPIIYQATNNLDSNSKQLTCNKTFFIKSRHVNSKSKLIK